MYLLIAILVACSCGCLTNYVLLGKSTSIFCEMVKIEYQLLGWVILGGNSGQSRTGGVLGAVQSAVVMGARRIFYRRGKFRGTKKWRPFFSRRPLKTRVFTVTTNAQNILQHFRGTSALKTFHFFPRGCQCSSKEGACAMAQWPVQAWWWM